MKEGKQTICPICNNELTFMKETLSDGSKICFKHIDEAGITMDERKARSFTKYSLGEIQEKIKYAQQKQREFELARDRFVRSRQFERLVAFDDENKQWALLHPVRGDLKEIFDYRLINDFELIEDGKSVVKGGLGRAVAGGLLFGGVGAIVGGVTAKKKSKGICNSLKIKVTQNELVNPVVYIDLISNKTKTDSTRYKKMIRVAEGILARFQAIVSQEKDTGAKQEVPDSSKESLSPIEEVKQLKELLDADILTQEEFDRKKKELLGL